MSDTNWAACKWAGATRIVGNRLLLRQLTENREWLWGWPWPWHLSASLLRFGHKLARTVMEPKKKWHQLQIELNTIFDETKMWSSARLLLLVHYKKGLKHIEKTINWMMMLSHYFYWSRHSLLFYNFNFSIAVEVKSTLKKYCLMSPQLRRLCQCGWMLSHSIVSSPRWHNLAAFHCQNFGELEESSSIYVVYSVED